MNHNINYLTMSKLQSASRVREHILQLHSDYRKTKSPIILDLIEDWKQVYINKKNNRR